MGVGVIFDVCVGVVVTEGVGVEVEVIEGVGVIFNVCVGVVFIIGVVPGCRSPLLLFAAESKFSTLSNEVKLLAALTRARLKSLKLG